MEELCAPMTGKAEGEESVNGGPAGRVSLNCALPCFISEENQPCTHTLTRTQDRRVQGGGRTCLISLELIASGTCASLVLQVLQRSRNGVTMLSRHSVGTYQGNELTRNS